MRNSEHDNGPGEPTCAEAEFARRLPEAMAGAAEGFPGPSGELVGRAVRRGRRLKAVRNAGIGGTALAVAAVGVLAGGLVRPPGPQRVATPATDGPPVHARIHVADSEVLAILAATLPAGGTTSDAEGVGTGTLDSPAQQLSARLTYRRGGRTSVVLAQVHRLNSVPRTGSGIVTETVSRTAHMPPVLPHRAQGSATVTLPDGGYVQLSESATALGDPTGLPALTGKQLAAAAHDTRWRQLISALATWQGPPPARMSATLRPLLPHGLTLSTPGATDGTAQIVADDGRGKAVVQVVDRYDTGEVGAELRCGPGDPHCTDGRLGDGTRWKLEDQEIGQGATSRVLRLQRPDGRQIAVRVLNAGSFHTSPDRTAPLLTDAQLWAIAKSPAWNG